MLERNPPPMTTDILIHDAESLALLQFDLKGRYETLHDDGDDTSILLAAIDLIKPTPDESFPIRRTITDPNVLDVIRNAFDDLTTDPFVLDTDDPFWADLVPTP